MDTHLTSGTIVHGRYRIEKTIGQGGFGITYLAEHLELGTKVCIKELFINGMCSRHSGNTVHSSSTKDFTFEYFIDRFLAEARELARFQHTGIVRVTDMFRDNGTAYFVMDYVQGKTLKQLVAENGRYSFEKALPIIRQLLDAVEVVHKRGMLHRDIKPDNILITEEGKVVLIDFGSARSFGGGHTMTQTAILTPGYAPIEQYSEKARRGPFTDIYALGATLYFMLTGQKPVPVTDRTLERLPAPHEINPAINQRVSSAIMLALNIKPEDRFQQVEDLRSALLAKPEEKADNDNKTAISKPEKATRVELPVKKSLGESSKRSNKSAWTIITLIILGGFFFFRADSVSEVKIGDQIWMEENLDVEKFRNGDPIPQARNPEEWRRAVENRQPAWCYSNYSWFSGLKYGKLYNYYAVTDVRRISPEGWHLPSDEEWKKLTQFLGGKEVAGNHLKSKRAKGANSSGFNALLGGYVDPNGDVQGISKLGIWWNWSFSRFTVNSCCLDANTDALKESAFTPSYKVGCGLSIRCIKNQSDVE